MSSITLKEVLEKAACRIPDGEDLVYGELNSAMAGLTKLLLEAMAESEVERRVGMRLHGRDRAWHRSGGQLSATGASRRSSFLAVCSAAPKD